MVPQRDTQSLKYSVVVVVVDVVVGVVVVKQFVSNAAFSIFKVEVKLV
jgi:hypothetical protein